METSLVLRSLGTRKSLFLFLCGQGINQSERNNLSGLTHKCQVSTYITEAAEDLRISKLWPHVHAVSLHFCVIHALSSTWFWTDSQPFINVVPFSSPVGRLQIVFDDFHSPVCWWPLTVSCTHTHTCLVLKVFMSSLHLWWACWRAVLLRFSPRCCSLRYSRVCATDCLSSVSVRWTSLEEVTIH